MVRSAEQATGDELQPFTFPEQEPIFEQGATVRNWRKWVAVFGPGALMAAMTIGSGEVVLGPRSAAWSQYGLLWVIVLGFFAKWFLGYRAGRYVVLTGESLLWRLHPRPISREVARATCCT